MSESSPERKSPIKQPIFKPKMILFDYGQTLANEKRFDPLAGTKALMEHAIANRHNHTAEEVDAAAASMNHEIGRDDPKTDPFRQSKSQTTCSHPISTTPWA